jgi:hypothetical protein
MKELLVIVLVDLGAIAALWAIFRWQDNEFQRGVEAGREAERQWLLEVSESVELEREKVWREEIAGE